MYIQICVITKCVKKGLHCIEYNFKIYFILVQLLQYAELFLAILGKGPWPKLGKNDRLNTKIGGEIDIHVELKKGSKINPQSEIWSLEMARKSPGMS